MSTPPCAFSGFRVPCESRNRTFRNHSCFDRHKTNKLRRKTVSEQKRNCANCGSLLTRKKHECYKPYCKNCMQNEKIGHLCYMRPLSDELLRSDNVSFVYYDFETRKNTRFTDSATVHVPNLVSLQKLCSQCETRVDIDEDCQRCGKRKHSFFEDPVGDLPHLCEPRGWCDRVFSKVHNARGYCAQRAILL